MDSYEKYQLEINGEEAKEHLKIYKKHTALKAIEKILTTTPDRILELGFNLSDVEEVFDDLEIVKLDYSKWCSMMEEKYKVNFTGAMLYSIDYMKKIIVYEK